MAHPQLSGHIDAEVVDREAELGPLRDRIEELEADLRKMRQERDKARAEGLAAISAISALRDQLSGLYRAMKAIFGEIELVSPLAASVPVPENGAATPSPQAGRWTNLLNKLGGHRASFIQALVDFGPSTASQIRAAMGITRMPTVYDTAHQLMKLGVVVKKGEAYALKE